MSLIVNKLLANDAFVFNEEILKLLQREKRAAYSPQSSGNGDPQVQEMVLSMQGAVLRHVLHPTVMTRLVDSAQYGNSYLPDEVLSDLHDGIFVQREVPTTFKMNPFPEREHSETLEQGDPNLHPELIDQVEVGFNFKNNNGDSFFSNI